jgi:hypothetical protein
MFLPDLFGPKAPKDDTAPTANTNEPGISKKQAKLQARAEKGDKRIQQVNRR